MIYQESRNNHQNKIYNTTKHNLYTKDQVIKKRFNTSTKTKYNTIIDYDTSYHQKALFRTVILFALLFIIINIAHIKHGIDFLQFILHFFGDIGFIKSTHDMDNTSAYGYCKHLHFI